MTTTNYRERIYSRYATLIQDAGQVFDAQESLRWGKAYDWFFRDWLPADRAASIGDLACGGGKILHFFKTRGYTQVRGVDISPEQVILSRQVLPDVTEGNVLDFLRQSAGKFDLLTALDLVEHLEKDEILDFLDGCYGALRSGGRLILQTSNAESPWAGHHRYNDLTHEVGLQANCLGRLLSLTGFRGIEPREMGPWVHGLKSAVRFAMWRCIKLGLKVWNLAEMGNIGSGVYTRIFLISAVKKESSVG